MPGNDFRGGTWGAHGVIVFSAVGRLLRVPDTGGWPTLVRTIDSGAKESFHQWPWFLPDGLHVLFLAQDSTSRRAKDRWGHADICAASIHNPAPTRIVESFGGAQYAAGWLLSREPRRLIAQPFDPERLTLQDTPHDLRDRLASDNLGPGFAVSREVMVVDRPSPIRHQLVWMDRTGKTLGTAGPVATITAFALAPDERRVAASVTDSDSLKYDLWLFDTGREESTRLTYQGRSQQPVWSLDGRHIYFTGSRLELRTLAIGTMAEEACLENPGSFVRFLDVTQDGQYLVFMAEARATSAEIWIVHIGHPDERRALVQGAFAATQARVSPDCRWLAYTLVLPSGREIFLQPFDRPGDRIQVSVKGGIGPVWRDDAQELYYEGPEGLMAVLVSESGGALEVGTPQKLFSIRTQGLVPTNNHNVEVAAHGEKFLVNTIVGDSDNVPLEVTLNWTTGLEQ